MKNRRFWPFFLSAMAVCLLGFSSKKGDPMELVFPKSWEKPRYDFSKNPLTRQGAELGRRLFYDPILSRDSTVSCASCHLSFTAFAHVDHALSHGIGDRIGTRNAPALANLAWAKKLMWDGAVDHLDFQALAPISNPDEMGSSIEKAVEKLSAAPRYRSLFEAAFGDGAVTGERVLKAIAQFELTLISAGSKYDRARAGAEKFSDQEQNGYRLFQKNCVRCHAEPFFTNHDFEKNGLPLDPALRDAGRMRITGAASDSLKFKVPTLRNAEFSQPYMHDGRFRKLRDVLDFYASSTAIEPKIELSENEKTDLLAFLLALTDRAFLFDPAFSFPKN